MSANLDKNYVGGFGVGESGGGVSGVKESLPDFLRRGLIGLFYIFSCPGNQFFLPLYLSF